MRLRPPTKHKRQNIIMATQSKRDLIKQGEQDYQEWRASLMDTPEKRARGFPPHMAIPDNSKPKFSLPKLLLSLLRQLSPELIFLAFDLLELLTRLLPRFFKESSAYDILDYDVTLLSVGAAGP